MKNFTKTKRNFVLLTLCILMVLITICPVSASKAGVVKSTAAANDEFSYMEVSKDYKQVAATDNLVMSADLNSGLFAIKNLKNGYIWNSVPDNSDLNSFSGGQDQKFSKSLLLIGYIPKEDEVSSPNVIFMDSYSATDVAVEEIDNGIKVDYTFTIDLTEKVSANDDDGEADITTVNADVPVEFYLKDDHLVANVDIKNVKITNGETGRKSNQIYITEYSVLPYFCSADWTEDGYLFVPDGSGALINFKGHENALDFYGNTDSFDNYNMVYGDDLCLVDKNGLSQKKTAGIKMPVFGIANKNGNAICGIVENHEACTSFYAAPHTNANGYNYIYPRITTRIISKTTMFGKSAGEQNIFRLSEKSKNIKNYTVSYYFLNGEEANYTGMAKTYRNYLIDNGVLKQTASKPKLNVDIYGAIDVKANFLGFTYNKVTNITTFLQAKKIGEALIEKGINNLGLRYLGWANNGLTNKNMPDSAKPLGILGGKDDYSKLIAFAKNNNVSLTNDVNLLTYTEGKNKENAKTAFGSTYVRAQYLKSVYATDLNGIKENFINPNYLTSYTSDLFDSYADLGVSDISLGSLSNTVYSSLKRGYLFFRDDFAAQASKVYSQAAKHNLTVSGEDANSYAFKYVDKIYKTPTYSSGFTIFDSEVPFYQIVLHGCIAMTGDAMVQSFDATTNYLKCVEAGIELLWDGIYEDAAQLNVTNYDNIYGSTYTLWADNAAEKYAEYEPLLEKIYDKTIISHKELTNQVTSTTYDNGITVYVNFGEEDYNSNGIKIPAKSFIYKEG